MPLHIIEEAIGRLGGVEPVAVIVEDIVQGEKGSLTPHPKALKISLLIGCSHVLRS